MRDKKLETKLRLVALQLDNWKKLHDLITYGLDKAKPIVSSEQERQFTEIRSNLLQETEYILRELNIVSEVSGKAMSVLQRGVSVRGVRDLPSDEIRRLETDWNSAFTKLGLIQGQLKARRKQLAEQSAFDYYWSQLRDRFFQRPATAH
ncbi:MAG TPA: hypothetical protein VG103_11890 [Chthoniobacterales bacterium]|jgi:hypothetical protein|nr:hypothetical protein [Chthoniobacterales bacterium]